MTALGVTRYSIVRLVATLTLAVLVAAVLGCSGKAAAPSPSPTPAEPAAQQPAPQEPQYSKWIVYINDDDSYTKGSITYSIALKPHRDQPDR